MRTLNKKTGLIRRLLAFVYDALVVCALWIVGTAALLPFNHGHVIAPHNIFYQIYLLLIPYCFFTEFWRANGQTLGMMAWKYKIVADNDENLTRKQMMIRFLVSILSFLSLGVGFIWQMFSSHKKSWPDIAAKTTLCRTE